MWPLLRRLLQILLYLALALFTALLGTLVAVFRYPDWHPEILRFSFRVWSAFLVHIGSTGPGFISPILISACSITLTIICIGYLQGWAAMKERWVENVLVTGVVFVTTLLLIYGPQFVWQVAKVARDERKAEVGIITRLQNAPEPSCREPKGVAEPRNSLRKRTLRIVRELSEFWSKRPTPSQQPVQNATSDEDRKRNTEWEQYWRDAKTAYDFADFRERLVGIVREYKNKGIGTGILEQSFD